MKACILKSSLLKAKESRSKTTSFWLAFELEWEWEDIFCSLRTSVVVVDGQHRVLFVAASWSELTGSRADLFPESRVKNKEAGLPRRDK